jgi:hypothetical protein
MTGNRGGGGHRPRKERPRPIGDLLTRYLEAAGLQEVERARRMVDSWRAVVSPSVFRSTRLLRVRDGVVHVGVGSSALLYELEGFKREEILAGLREQNIGYVRSVKFKLLALADPADDDSAEETGADAHSN